MTTFALAMQLVNQWSLSSACWHRSYHVSLSMLARRQSFISVMSLTQDLPYQFERMFCFVISAFVNISVTTTSGITCLLASNDLSSWCHELATHYLIWMYYIRTSCHSLSTHFSLQLFCIRTKCHLIPTHISILVVQHHCMIDMVRWCHC